ncbi:MAG: hypothetical protein LJE96_13185 [Deltaproteobacteria bacterium]|nr:hypothetical protein [Deltaproteobacteria bacterium]
MDRFSSLPFSINKLGFSSPGPSRYMIRPSSQNRKFPAWPLKSPRIWHPDTTALERHLVVAMENLQAVVEQIQNDSSGEEGQEEKMKDKNNLSNNRGFADTHDSYTQEISLMADRSPPEAAKVPN